MLWGLEQPRHTDREMDSAWWHLALFYNDTESGEGDASAVIELLKVHGEV